MKGGKHTPEAIAKMRAAKVGSKNPMWGKKHSPETIEKMRATKMGLLNPMWKGDEAKEAAIRNRLQRSMPVPKGSDRHHIDGNVRNSDPSNIRVLTRKEHMIKDGRMEAFIKRNKENLMIGSKHPRWQGDTASNKAKRKRGYRARRRAIRNGEKGN